MSKTIEIDEEEFLRNQRLKKTVETIMADPKARVLVEQAHKLVNPDAKTPTLDAQKTTIEPIDTLRKEMSEFIAAQTKDRDERDAAAKRESLKSQIEDGIAKLRQNGWTDEGIKAVERIMEDKGILDPEIAAAYHEKLHPPQVPSTPTGGAWNFPEIPKDGGDAYEKALLDSKGQNDLIAEREAMNVLNEIRGVSRR